MSTVLPFFQVYNLQDMRACWTDEQISDWLLLNQEILCKSGGCGKILKGHRHIHKSLKMRTMSLYCGFKGEFAGGFVVKGILKYAKVYNIDTDAVKKASTLFLKLKHGMPDDPLFNFGPRLCRTAGRCNNIVGAR